MTRFLAALPLMMIPMTAFAEGWITRSGDEVYDPDQLEGQTLTFYDDGQSRYAAGGSYSYTYSAVNGGGTAYGTYRVVEDGSVCVDFRNGFARCDLYVLNNGRLILITEDGQRYPVRP